MGNEEQVHFTMEDRKTLTKVETKLDRALQDIADLTKNFAGKSELYELDKRVQKLEDANSWIVKTVFGIIISAIITVMLAIGK